jgi:hypothetical protein
VKKQKAGARTPALQAHRDGSPVRWTSALALVHLRSVHQCRQAGNGLRSCKGVDIAHQNGVALLSAELSDLAEVLADWIKPAPGVPAVYLYSEVAFVEIIDPIATSTFGCFSMNGKMSAVRPWRGGASKTRRILRTLNLACPARWRSTGRHGTTQTSQSAKAKRVLC